MKSHTAGKEQFTSDRQVCKRF